MHVVINWSSRLIKKHQTVEISIRVDCLCIFYISHFSRFLNSSAAHAKIVEVILFYLNKLKRQLFLSFAFFFQIMSLV